MAKFGEIYRVNKNPPETGILNHWIVILGDDPISKNTYYQVLSSRMYKVFPNYGFLTNQNCSICLRNPQFGDYIQNSTRYRNTPQLCIDIDCVVFLNRQKYQSQHPLLKKMSRETYLGLVRTKSTNTFNLEYQIQQANWVLEGSLLSHNKMASIFSMKNSVKISRLELSTMTKAYQQNK